MGQCRISEGKNARVDLARGWQRTHSDTAICHTDQRTHFKLLGKVLQNGDQELVHLYGAHIAQPKSDHAGHAIAAQSDVRPKSRSCVRITRFSARAFWTISISSNCCKPWSRRWTASCPCVRRKATVLCASPISARNLTRRRPRGDRSCHRRPTPRSARTARHLLAAGRDIL
jgi:hypothetical protein